MRQALGLLALAAGWVVLVADGGDNWRLCEDVDVRYEFQTNCMGEPASGLLNLQNDSTCYWSSESGEWHSDFLAIDPTLGQIKKQGLNVQNVVIIYKQPNDKLIPIGFDFQIIGEPVKTTDAPVDASDNSDTPVPTFICLDSRAHETLAVDKDYLCENPENPSETCELKLTYSPRE